MKELSIEQKNNLCDILAKIVFDLKKYKNVECITIEDKNDFLIIKIIIKTKSYGFNLDLDIKMYDMLTNSIEDKLGINIVYNVDESCYYNNIFDNNNAFNDILKKDFMDSIILYEKSAKYKMIQNKLYLQEKLKQDSLDLPLYNIRK